MADADDILWSDPIQPGGQVMARARDGDEVILVHHQGAVHAWRNSCPHVGVGLDYGDGSCLAEPGVLICSLHGALFEADTGFCFAGPCAGDHLRPVPIQITEEGVVVCAAS